MISVTDKTRLADKQYKLKQNKEDNKNITIIYKIQKIRQNYKRKSIMN